MSRCDSYNCMITPAMNHSLLCSVRCAAWLLAQRLGSRRRRRRGHGSVANAAAGLLVGRAPLCIAACSLIGCGLAGSLQAFHRPGWGSERQPRQAAATPHPLKHPAGPMEHGRA